MFNEHETLCNNGRYSWRYNRESVDDIVGFTSNGAKDKFDTIQCSQLEVVDAAGKHSVIIDSTSDRVGAYSKDGKTALVGFGEVGGHVFIVDKYGNVKSLD